MGNLFSDPVKKVTLASSNLNKSIQYWNKTLRMKLLAHSDSTAVFAFNECQTKLELKDIGT